MTAQHEKGCCGLRRDTEASKLFPDIRLRLDLLDLCGLQSLALLLLDLELLDSFELKRAVPDLLRNGIQGAAISPRSGRH
ncbi:hypothetical protein NM688_g9385 [Phlebia brevispora]|uniref:Uncharacterized protein n=1 Tax=Phlebia brevispora TaxID=194682 RepID=A0ACC1RI66_9APHY|nr:hypothetical protein NM688_g9385 [Phlebia brevispora]